MSLSRNQKYTLGLAAGSAIISLAAAALAVMGYVNAEHALAISQQEFLDSRLAIYDGQVNAANDEILIRPVDPAVRMLQGQLRLPSSLDDTTWTIGPPAFGFPLVMTRFHLVSLLDTVVTRNAGYIMYMPDTSVPVVIRSSYTVKGQAYSECSLYELTFAALFFEAKTRPPEVTFNGLTFRERIPIGTDPMKVLDQTWAGRLPKWTAGLASAATPSAR